MVFAVGGLALARVDVRRGVREADDTFAPSPDSPARKVKGPTAGVGDQVEPGGLG